MIDDIRLIGEIAPMVRGRHKARCVKTAPFKAAITLVFPSAAPVGNSNSPGLNTWVVPPRIAASENRPGCKSTCQRGLPLARKLTSASRCARARLPCQGLRLIGLAQANGQTAHHRHAPASKHAACAYSAPLNPSHGDMICWAQFFIGNGLSNAQPKAMMNSRQRQEVFKNGHYRPPI